MHRLTFLFSLLVISAFCKAQQDAPRSHFLLNMGYYTARSLSSDGVFQQMTFYQQIHGEHYIGGDLTIGFGSPLHDESIGDLGDLLLYILFPVSYFSPGVNYSYLQEFSDRFALRGALTTSMIFAKDNLYLGIMPSVISSYYFNDRYGIALSTNYRWNSLNPVYELGLGLHIRF